MPLSRSTVLFGVDFEYFKKIKHWLNAKKLFGDTYAYFSRKLEKSCNITSKLCFFIQVVFDLQIFNVIVIDKYHFFQKDY